MPHRLADAHPWSMSVRGCGRPSDTWYVPRVRAFWHSMDGDSTKRGTHGAVARDSGSVCRRDSARRSSGPSRCMRRTGRSGASVPEELRSSSRPETRDTLRRQPRNSRDRCVGWGVTTRQRTTRASRAKPHDDLVSQVLCRSAQALILAARVISIRRKNGSRFRRDVRRGADPNLRAISGWISPRCSGGRGSRRMRGRDTSGAGALRAQRNRPAAAQARELLVELAPACLAARSFCDDERRNRQRRPGRSILRFEDEDAGLELVRDRIPRPRARVAWRGRWGFSYVN